MNKLHLAQFNIGRMMGPLDGPVMRGFVERLDEINALADGTPGFVWRLQSDSGNATDIRPFDDPNLLLNMSVWRDLASLSAYVYRSEHVAIMRRRREWFEPMERAYLVLWWVPNGHRPSIDEAVARLETLRRKGPTSEAFTFRQAFAAPDAVAEKPPLRFGDACPAA